MKKKIALLLGAAIVAQSVMAMSASAAHKSAYDINIRLNSSLLGKIVQPLTGTGETTYQLQEGVHSLLGNTTGLELDYFYVNLYVNDQHVAAIDPPLPMY
ncbi:hypothetical protein FE782_20035 [Paenibacillus antri]|uniref:DUF4183 domain-containing protein n=1 Tax=Paenibacillus antri TaxID=2582848 RepID=A0A5R9G8B4_9BACL|nr:hypothetical protein [Paenibacillus antri]TLS50320.1 hypothetical protein FE782_20035 [Paenibacillus antri]